MARKTKPLTDTEIKAAKPKDADYQLYDGDGLTLLIRGSTPEPKIFLRPVRAVWKTKVIPRQAYF
ncbi:hypothetical protein AB3Y61_003839 [Serratia marcescens]